MLVFPSSQLRYSLVLVHCYRSMHKLTRKALKAPLYLYKLSPNVLTLIAYGGFSHTFGNSDKFSSYSFYHQFQITASLSWTVNKSLYVTAIYKRNTLEPFLDVTNISSGQHSNLHRSLYATGKYRLNTLEMLLDVTDIPSGQHSNFYNLNEETSFYVCMLL